MQPLNLWIILYTNLLLLRRYWADFQKKSRKGSIQWFLHNRWSDLTSFALLCFLIFLFPGRWWHEILVTAFGKVEHHSFSSFVPISVWFTRIGSAPVLLWSRSEKWPTFQQESASTVRYCHRIRNTFFCVSSFSPYNVVVHWHEDDPTFKRFSKYHLILFFRASAGWSLISPRRSTESEKMLVLAFVISMALSRSRVVDLHVVCSQSIVVRPLISVWSSINLFSHLQTKGVDSC